MTASSIVAGTGGLSPPLLTAVWVRVNAAIKMLSEFELAETDRARVG